MGWKCDICDSYNEESSRQCYVCGQARSVESIREGKIKEREEIIEKINFLLVNRVYIILKTMFLLGLSVSIIVIVTGLIIIGVRRELDYTWLIIKTIGGRIIYNLSFVFNRSLIIFSSNSFSTPADIISTNVKSMGVIMDLNRERIIQTIILVLSTVAGVNCRNCYNYVIRLS